MTKTSYISVPIALLVAVLAASLLALGLPQVASSEEKKDPKKESSAGGQATAQGEFTAQAQQAITSTGPLTKLVTTDTLNCQAYHQNDGNSGEFYDTSDVGDCGTFLAVGGVTYGPSVVNAGPQAVDTPFTPVSQSAVTGSGTQADPLKLVTVVDAGTTGLRLTQTDSYVTGEDEYRTDVKVENRGTSSQSAILYRAGDCYLQNSDFGFGSVDSTTGAVRCVIGVEDPSTGQTEPGERIMEWLPLTSGSSYYEAKYWEVWDKIGAKQAFNNSCFQCSAYVDNGAGLSWNITLSPGGQVTHSHQTIIDTGTAPTTSGLSPRDGATGVLRSTNVSATFSEPMNPDTLTDATFTLVKAGTTTPVSATVSYDAVSQTVTLNPFGSSTQKLSKKKIYTAKISGAKDLAGNPLPDAIWSFKTGRR